MTAVRRGAAVLAWVAAVVGTAMAGMHVAWALGVRWGYSSCGWGSLTRLEARTGCDAVHVADVGLWDGWMGAGGWFVVAALAGAVALGARVPRPLVAAAALALLIGAFPLHLLFEVPVGLAGEPTDWRHVATRVVAVLTAILLLLPLRRPPCPHPWAGPVPMPPPVRRAVAVAALTPLVGWSVPHLVWMTGLALGIPEDVLHQGRDLPLAAQVAITFGPALGAVLTAALLTPLAQRWPTYLPVVGGRRVPPLLPVVAAGSVGALLAAYGVLGCTMMLRDLGSGRADVAGLVEGWAVVATELTFVVWGAALLAAAVGFARATACRPCRVGHDRLGEVSRPRSGEDAGLDLGRDLG